jgi:hypothetical protein
MRGRSLMRILYALTLVLILAGLVIAFVVGALGQ